MNIHWTLYTCTYNFNQQLVVLLLVWLFVILCLSTCPFSPRLRFICFVSMFAICGRLFFQLFVFIFIARLVLFPKFVLFVAALSLSLSVYLYCLLFVFSFSTPLLWLEPHFVAVSVALCTQSDGSHFNTVITLTYHFSKDPNSFRSFIADALTNQRSPTKAERLASGFFRNRLTTSGLTN